MIGKLVSALSRRVQAHEMHRLLLSCQSVGAGVRLRPPVVIYHAERLSFGDQVDVGEFIRRESQ